MFAPFEVDFHFDVKSQGAQKKGFQEESRRDSLWETVIVLEMQVNGVDAEKLIMKIIKIQKDV